MLLADPLDLMPAPATDLAFLIATEEFVRDTGACRADALSREDDTLVKAMGSPYYWRRQHATAILRGQWHDATRALIWGTWSTDPEISRRARGLLSQLACVWCRGTGLCPDCGGYFSGNIDMEIRCTTSLLAWESAVITPDRRICYCPECHGTGLARQRELLQSN